MDIQEKQDKINSIIRLIAYSVFYKNGDYKFANAYDKLYGKVYLDHGIHIGDRIEQSGMDNISMFDVIHEDELEKVLQSSLSLLTMYEEVIESKVS